MNTISCLIVDDEPNAVKLLEDHIQKVPFLQLKQKCFDAFEAISFLQKERVDIIFLDINMPEMSGMELAAVLPKDQGIIFTSAYSSYALEGYEYNAVDYLLKPITIKRFLQAVYKARRYFPAVATEADPGGSLQADYMFIKTGKQIVKIEYQKVLYFEAVKEYVNIVSTEGKNLVYKRMKQLELQLPVSFIRIHNSYIINLDRLEKIADNYAIIGQAKLPVSASYREQLLSLVEKKLL